MPVQGLLEGSVKGPAAKDATSCARSVHLVLCCLGSLPSLCSRWKLDVSHQHGSGFAYLRDQPSTLAEALAYAFARSPKLPVPTCSVSQTPLVNTSLHLRQLCKLLLCFGELLQALVTAVVLHESLRWLEVVRQDGKGDAQGWLLALACSSAICLIMERRYWRTARAGLRTQKLAAAAIAEPTLCLSPMGAAPGFIVSRPPALPADALTAPISQQQHPHCDRLTSSQNPDTVLDVIGHVFKTEPCTELYLADPKSDGVRFWRTMAAEIFEMVHASSAPGPVVYAMPTSDSPSGAALAYLWRPDMLYDMPKTTAMVRPEALEEWNHVSDLCEKLQLETYEKYGTYITLDFVGVMPGLKGTGLGRELLEAVLADADAAGVAVFLDACGPRNQAWYGRHGFQLIQHYYATVPGLPGHRELAFMVRPPAGRTAPCGAAATADAEARKP